MRLPVIRCGMGMICALALSMGPLHSTTHAGMYPWGYNGYGYSTYYAPSSAGYGYSTYYAPSAGYGYTVGYGGYGGGCCLTSLFHGCGLFGCSRPYYASYYAPSYAPSCGTCGSCNSCGSCGWESSAYALGSDCCSDGCASGDCGVVPASGVESSPTPYSGEPVPSRQPASPSTPPQTYREPAEDGGFSKPQPIPGTDGGGGLFPPSDEPASGPAAEPSAGSDGVTPAGGVPDSEIERDGGIQFDLFKIPAKDRDQTEPAESSDESDADEDSRVIEPLDVDSQVAYRAQPERRRAYYRALFRTPAIARTSVPATGRWEAIDDGTELVSSLTSKDR